MEAKTKKILIATSIIGALAIVTTAFIIRARRKKLLDKIESGSEDILLPAKETASEVVYPLKRGMGINQAERNAIKVVQRYVNARSSIGTLKMVTLEEDGIFGPATENGLQTLMGVKEVSYSLYKQMYEYLYSVPDLLSKNTGSYSGTTNSGSSTVSDNIDPFVAKNLFQ